MIPCPACGQENRVGAKFCSECAAPLIATTVSTRQERKVVTVLFADLVGFTARSEQLDPEDVQAFLSPYYARLRTELEGFGGTVEKFIGDAVMAVFGAPLAHEDDPERAVRAALAIRAWVAEHESGLQLRIAVNTGEVLVALSARPGHGEGMVSGDVVNTTARLQTAAPVNGILVGETTYRATSHVIDYRATAPVTAKGKAEPVPAWEALEARSRFGVDLAPARRAPLVGRARELGVLTDALARVRQDRSPQLVTVAGVPGIGKSRIVGELARTADEDVTELIFWRQGRSLPYGDGVTFWALAEMVKAQAGILESDSPDQAEEKLHHSVTALFADPADAGWVTGHLRPLAGVGVGNDGEAGTDRRDEAFTAWRRYFEALAERSPLVLVFEDLHWADDNLLDFIDHLMDWVSGVPMLTVCTARPELFERRPGWGGGTRNSTTVRLAPLSEGETVQLIGSLSGRVVMPAETQHALLARAGGNPLYAEQYVRMLAERGGGEDLPLPETVHGIIAARVDALPAEEKRLLQSASVMGKVFWLGGLSAGVNGDRRSVERHLHSLERKDFVQRARRSSVAEEAEYSFLHVLVRDVAYGQIPRGERAEQHRLAADWLASLGRTEDHAEMLAHHYLKAIELWRAAGRTLDATVTAAALASLVQAGDRATSLNAHGSAAGFYSSALDLTPRTSAPRAHLLFKLARARYHAGDTSIKLLGTACVELVAAGEPETAAEAGALLAEVSWYRGERGRAFEHLGHARGLVENAGPSRAKAYVIGTFARYLMLAGENQEAIRLGREALGMAEILGLDELRAESLNTVGCSRVFSGDPSGSDDLERGLAVAEEANVPVAICRARVNLATVLSERGQLELALAMQQEASAVASRFGLASELRWSRGERPGMLFLLGRWDEALSAADEFIAEVEDGSPHYLASFCYETRAQIRIGRDDTAGALADAEQAIELARQAADPQNLFPTVTTCASVFRECGDLGRAAMLAGEFVAELREGARASQLDILHMLAWTMSALGRGEELIDILPVADSPWVSAARAFADGDLRGAADICGEMGAVSQEARDRLWLAEALARQGRRPQADVELQRALAFYRSVGATRYIREAESLLAASA